MNNNYHTYLSPGAPSQYHSLPANNWTCRATSRVSIEKLEQKMCHKFAKPQKHKSNLDSNDAEHERKKQEHQDYIPNLSHSWQQNRHHQLKPKDV